MIHDLGISQAQVALAAEMSASQLSRALSGQKVFTLDQLDAVCAALDLDLVRIVADADEASRGRGTPGNVTPFPAPNVGTLSDDEMHLAARPADPEPTDEQLSPDDPS